MTGKLTRYTKWTQSLTMWLLSYVAKCENTLKGRVQLLLPFLDVNTEGTSCLFPMIVYLMDRDAAYLKEHFYQRNDDISTEQIQTDLDSYRWKCVNYKLLGLLPQLVVEQLEMASGKRANKRMKLCLSLIHEFWCMPVNIIRSIFMRKGVPNSV